MQKRRIPFCRDLVAMWLSFTDPKSSILQKFGIIVALLYLVNPLDLIPDLIPITGLLDDLGIIAIAFAFLRSKIKPHHWEQAEEKCRARLK